MNKEDCWMTTYTGRKFYPLDPKIEDIELLDIAQALSMICRFNGHTKLFYSVAEHSVRGISLVPERDRLAFLLHDASEAYMADVGRAVKSAIPDYKLLEKQLLEVIYLKFGVEGYNQELIKRADNILLATEGRDLMENTHDWFIDESPVEHIIEPWSQIRAEVVFLYEFEKLHS